MSEVQVWAGRVAGALGDMVTEEEVKPDSVLAAVLMASASGDEERAAGILAAFAEQVVGVPPSLVGDVLAQLGDGLGFAGDVLQDITGGPRT